MIFCAYFLDNFNDCSGTTADMTHSDSTKTMGEFTFLNSPIISTKKTPYFQFPHFFNFVFKNVSPLGFMIAILFKKRVSTQFQGGSTP